MSVPDREVEGNSILRFSRFLTRILHSLSSIVSSGGKVTTRDRPAVGVRGSTMAHQALKGSALCLCSDGIEMTFTLSTITVSKN